MLLVLWTLDIRAARQSHIFSFLDYFDAFFDAEHENLKKKKNSKTGDNWLFGAKVLIYSQKINVFIYFLKGAISPNNHCFYPKHA